jgi:hypothetical protein
MIYENNVKLFKSLLVIALAGLLVYVASNYLLACNYLFPRSTVPIVTSCDVVVKRDMERLTCKSAHFLNAQEIKYSDCTKYFDAVYVIFNVDTGSTSDRINRGNIELCQLELQGGEKVMVYPTVTYVDNKGGE